MKWKAFTTAVLMAALTAAHPVCAAAYHTETEVTNQIGTGDISIRLDEYELDVFGNEVPYSNHKTVLPGQTLDKIVRITNQADTAWIRAKLTCYSEDGIENLSDDMIVLASESWLHAGDYYYYTAPAEKGAAVDFMNKLIIPSQWNESYGGKEFSLAITAEAVQTDHFTPDFTCEDPWFGTVIETCIHTPYTASYTEQQQFSVVFEGGSEGLIRFGNDFFANWGELMPGDKVSDTVKIRNTYHRPVAISFRTETISDDSLLKALHLEIRNQDTLLYSGTLDGSVKDSVELAYLRQGEDTTLFYTLIVPEELNNAYALARTKTKWIFSAQMNRSGGGSGGSGGGQPKTPPSVQAPEQPSEAAASPSDAAPPEEPLALRLAETGDGSHTGLLTVLFMISAAGGLGIVWKVWKHKKKQEEHHTWEKER